MPGRRENTEQTEQTEQTEKPKEIPSVPSFPFVPYSLIPFIIPIPRLRVELPKNKSRHFLPYIFLFGMTRLFATKSDYGVDFRRPPRRDVTCQQRHYGQQRGHANVRQRVGRRDIEEQTSQQACHRECPQ